MPAGHAGAAPRRAAPGAGEGLNPLLAVPIAALIAAIAWRLRTLTGSGAFAACAVGSATLLGAGWWGGALLLAFFVGSTLVSRATADPAVERGDAKGNTRDWAQVLANGGAPAAGALLGLAEPTVGLWALTCGLAAAAADTWATSIGATSPTPPRHLLSREAVPAGTSGGVTLHGTFGGMLGALSVAGVAWVAGAGTLLPLLAMLAGTFGMLLDSFLGAAMQGRFHCDRCDVGTERPIHRCGAAARPLGGIPWMTNDSVNALATSVVTIIGVLLGLMIQLLSTPQGPR